MGVNGMKKLLVFILFVLFGTHSSAQSVLIKDLQSELIKNGFLSSSADGIYGAKTEQALLEFGKAELNINSDTVFHEHFTRASTKLRLKKLKKISEGHQYYRNQALRTISEGNEKTLKVFWQQKSQYRKYKQLPCNVNFAGVGNSAYPRPDFDVDYDNLINRCVHKRRGKTPIYFERDGTSFNVPHGTAVLAIANLEFVKAKDFGAKYRCHVKVGVKGFDASIVGERPIKVEDPLSPGTYRFCQAPYDGIEIIFRIRGTEDLVKYYHLSSTPVVPGFGLGKCALPLMKDRTAHNRHTRYHVSCGGAKKKHYQKGDVIGYSGATGKKGQHFGWNIFRNGKWLIAPEDQTQWENKPIDQGLYLFPIPPKK